MNEKKLNMGEPLTPALTDLEVGDVLVVPYKLYSERTIRATASQVKAGSGMTYEVNAKGEKSAKVTRTA